MSWMSNIISSAPSSYRLLSYVCPYGYGCWYGCAVRERVTFTVTQPPVAGNIEQALDTHLHFGTKLTFYLELVGNDGTDGIQLIVVPFMYFLVERNVWLLDKMY